MDPNNISKEYSNGQTTILWQSGKCSHSGICAKNLAAVFKPREKPWIQMDGTADEEIKSTVAKCPSGALSIKL